MIRLRLAAQLRAIGGSLHWLAGRLSVYVQQIQFGLAGHPRLAQDRTAFHGAPMKKLFLAFLCVTLACSSDSTGPTEASVAGTWTLQSINGTNLPFVFAQTGANKAEITADVLTVTSSGSFTQITTVRITENGQVTTQTVPDAGSYVLNGTNVTFQFQSDGSIGTGTVSGGTLTVSTPGFSYIYKKQ